MQPRPAVMNSQVESRIIAGVANKNNSAPTRLERKANIEKNRKFKKAEIIRYGLNKKRKYEEKMIKRLATILSMIPIFEKEDPGNPDKTAKISSHLSLEKSQ